MIKEKERKILYVQKMSRKKDYIGMPQKLTHVKCDRESAIHKPSQNGGKK